MAWLQETPQGVALSLRIVPRAARDAVQGVLGDALKIRLTAPPVEGQANAALMRFLADRLDLPARQVHLLSGLTGRSKRVLVQGLSAAAIRARLLEPT
ncbi:MAG: DUF167 domain-containing protein [Kiritimatiellaeota bacterium]|nr:DUF167 domain-containing protein [Kiritimatiellota bacterium]